MHFHSRRSMEPSAVLDISESGKASVRQENLLLFFVDSLAECRLGKLPLQEILDILHDISVSDIGSSLPWSAVLGIAQGCVDKCKLQFMSWADLREEQLSSVLQVQLLEFLFTEINNFVSQKSSNVFLLVDESALPLSKWTMPTAELAVDDTANIDMDPLPPVHAPPIQTIASLPCLAWQPNSRHREHILASSSSTSSPSSTRGQKKLLLMEMQFLCDYCKEGDTVLYVGGAPGNHISLLSSFLFPHLNFILYDPAPFHSSLNQSLSNVKIYNSMFDEDAAFVYASMRDRLLFISDVRRIQEDEDLVADDLNLQANWCRIICPRAAMLKFRPRYGSGRTVYFDGKLLLQPYSSPRSTEMRLVVEAKTADLSSNGFERLCVYDNKVYEEKLFYFNTHIRRKPQSQQQTNSETSLHLNGNAWVSAKPLDTASIQCVDVDGPTTWDEQIEFSIAHGYCQWVSQNMATVKAYLPIAYLALHDDLVVFNASKGNILIWDFCRWMTETLIENHQAEIIKKRKRNA